MTRRPASALALFAAIMTVAFLGIGAHSSRRPSLDGGPASGTLASIGGDPAFDVAGGGSRAMLAPIDTPETIDSTRRGPLSSEDSARALQKLSDDIKALVKLPAEVKAGRVGIEVRSLTAGKILYAMNADKPLTPASNTKVVTSFTALSELGPTYTVRTVVSADAKPGRDGIVKGNLYVKGYGDPFLTVTEIDGLVDQLVDAGVRQIDGNIVGDGSFFDNKTERTQYSGDADVVVPLPPIAALTISQSVFSVVVSSPRTPGEPCNVQTFPHSSGFEIINDAVSATPRAARAPARKGGARKGKRRSGLVAPATADENAPRYGDEVAAPYPFADAGAQPTQKKPAKKAAATATKKGATPAGKQPAARKGTVAAKNAKTTTKPAAGKRTATTAKQTKAAAKSAKTTAAAAKTARKPAKAPVKAVAAKPVPAKRETAREAAPDPAPATPSRGPLKVSVTTAENGRQIITVTGSMPANRTVSYRYQMKNPPQVIAGMIYDRLRSHGIAISGTPVSGVAPARGRTLAETGRPLVEILHLVMKNSNNFLAEYVFKMIGAAAGGQQETAQKSLEKIQHRMTLNHVNFSKCIINDGSGLSRANCLSASSLTGILEAAYNDHKIFEAFYPVMSIAGVDGTLRRRMRGTYAQGNVHGKTGTLNNVSALTGYVTTRDGEFLCFSMLMNGGNQGAYHSVQDRVAARLAAFSFNETLTSLDKAPPAK